jgi:hypothetical protein
LRRRKLASACMIFQKGGGIIQLCLPLGRIGTQAYGGERRLDREGYDIRGVFSVGARGVIGRVRAGSGALNLADRGGVPWLTGERYDQYPVPRHERACASRVAATGRNRKAGAYTLTHWSISYSGPGEACVRMEVLLEGRRAPAGGGLETRDQAPLRDGSRHRGPCAGPCGWEGGSGCDKHAVIPMAMPGRWDQRPPAGPGTPRMRGRAPFARRLDHLFTARCPCRAPGRAPDRAAPWPCLPSSFRAQASVRTRASTEKRVLSLSKRHPHGPIGASRSAPSGV